MPHKRKRAKGKNDPDTYDLPPSTRARPLAVGKAQTAPTNPRAATQSPRNTDPQRSKTRSLRGERHGDDTPRAFARLLMRCKPRSGLDDGEPGDGGVSSSKKRKRQSESSSASVTQPTTVAPQQQQQQQQQQSGPSSSIAPDSNAMDRLPQIQHYESLAQFSARVDAALPFKGLARKKGMKSGDVVGGKERQTRLEKKMQRMQAQWREEDRRLRERREAEEDERLADGGDGMGDDRVWMESSLGAGGAGGKKGRKRKKGKGGKVEVAEGDIWAGVEGRNGGGVGGNGGRGGLVGLHDVVQAPPKLRKMRRGVSVQSEGEIIGAGGLKRKAEIDQARRETVERYSEMMKGKRADSS